MRSSRFRSSSVGYCKPLRRTNKSPGWNAIARANPMHPDVSWAVWSSERARRVEAVMDALLPPANELPQSLHEAMRYAVLGGKRARALLAYAAGELADADPKRVDFPAAAVELIHAYSLIHDDLPCMEADVSCRLRRSDRIARRRCPAELRVRSARGRGPARSPARLPPARPGHRVT